MDLLAASGIWTCLSGAAYAACLHMQNNRKRGETCACCSFVSQWYGTVVKAIHMFVIHSRMHGCMHDLCLTDWMCTICLFR